MLSGIGPGDELKRHGIEVIHELPGVGRNLQDHVDCVIAYACTQPITLHRNLRADRLIGSVIAGMLFGRGIATTARPRVGDGRGISRHARMYPPRAAIRQSWASASASSSDAPSVKASGMSGKDTSTAPLSCLSTLTGYASRCAISPSACGVSDVLAGGSELPKQGPMRSSATGLPKPADTAGGTLLMSARRRAKLAASCRVTGIFFGSPVLNRLFRLECVVA